MRRLMAFLLFFPLFLGAQTFEMRGQAVSWLTLNTEHWDEPQIGLRYIPEIRVIQPVLKQGQLDLEVSFNGYGAWQRRDGEWDSADKIKPYRMWLRYSNRQCEIRLGLQKINFGTASMLRPLMWFDRMDPRDPLQLTDGVWGGLFRYYFLSNMNVWAWVLYNNDDTKGWEFIPTADNEPEYGLRLQAPVPGGEAALSYHHRRLDLNRGMEMMLKSMGISGPLPWLPKLGTAPENRFGLDARWDVTVGLWFEGALIHQDLPLEGLPVPQYFYQRLLNAGLDYTVPLGNGLLVMAEQFRYETSEKALGQGEGFDFTALSLNYPLGLLDTVTGMLYYDWENDSFYRFIRFQRTWDRWQIHLMGFWNPDEFELFQNSGYTNNLFAGKGVQVMVAFNH